MKNTILFLLLVLFSLELYGKNKHIQYQKPQLLDSRHGLSNTKVNDIVQDKEGYIWIATDNGLNKYDGYKFVVYKKEDKKKGSLINNYITSLYYDSQNRLWVGTMNGLQYYDRDYDCFTTVTLGQFNSVAYKSYNYIMEDSQKNLWLSIHDVGVVKYSLKTKEFNLYTSLGNGGDLCSSSIRHIMEDKEGQIWMSSFDKGITVYNPKNGEYHYYTMENSNLPTNSILKMELIGNDKILLSTLGKGVVLFSPKTNECKQTNILGNSFTMSRISDSSIVVGTEGDGLYISDFHNEDFIPHYAIPSSYREVISGKIHSLFEDANQNLWIGVYNRGVCYLKKEPKGFYKFQKDYDTSNSLSYDQIAGVSIDKEGIVWFATDGGGLSKYEPQTQRFTHFNSKNSSLPDDAVVCSYVDKENQLWLGTYLGGLSKYVKSKDSFLSFRHSLDSNSIAGNFVKAIIEDNQDNLWIGLDVYGISRFDKKTEKFTNFSSLDHSNFISDNVISLFLQNDEVLWIGSYIGLSLFNLQTEEFLDTQHYSEIKGVSIYCITSDKKKNLWLGTSSGLFKYDQENDYFEYHALSDNIRDFVINGIVSYDTYLWLSTDDGVVCYNYEKYEVEAMINNTDLDGINFIKSSYFMSPDNYIYFGGGNGCYTFHPDSIELSHYSPPVYITGIQIFNKAIEIGKKYNGRILLPKSIHDLDEIHLRYSENNFSLSFSTPMPKYAASNLYSCKLEGVDSEWTLLSPMQQGITYANLHPGEYIFKVCAGNVPHYRDANITTLKLIVLNPWWMTWWAKVVYFLIAIGVVFLILWIIYVRIKDRNELFLERLKAKKQEELNDNKLQFFTNISHEFRTPLTLIISPLQELIQKENNKEHKKLFSIMLRNANRLLRLINQILDFRKVENNQIELKVQAICLPLFVRSFTEAMLDIINKREINYSLVVEEEDIMIYYDADLLEKCLYNLFFNALKYTPNKGTITIKIKRGIDDVMLKITDSGKGINSRDIPYIFDRFYQGEFSQKSGTGVGLHLVKNIVELHSGSICVDSIENEGSCFTLHIKKGFSHFDQKDCLLEAWSPTDLSLVDDLEESVDLVLADSGKKEEKPIILLVEDESDMRMFVKHELENEYQIIEADNGENALNQMKSIEPNLIIADMMMPQMDGLEFIQRVKDSMETFHIPIIMLTANSEIEYKVKGIEVGADSYIVKPFNVNYLRTRIRKLLEVRKKLQEKYKNFLSILDVEKDAETKNPEEELLKKMVGFIKDNISDSSLTVETIAKELGISRTNLHKKIKTLIDKTPVELLRELRMCHAAQLLKTGNLNVSDVAYQVGFNSLSYFSSTFTSYWGVSPSVYIKENS